MTELHRGRSGAVLVRLAGQMFSGHDDADPACPRSRGLPRFIAIAQGPVSRITVLVAAAAICTSAGDALAGGMMLPVRGVRTIERAGALIAGSDDADSLWLDRAGLAHLAGDGRTQLFFDVGVCRSECRLHAER